MGRVAGSYGVRGWVKLAPDRGAGEALAAAKEWWIGAQAYRVREAKLHGAAVVGKLAGIETREQALALKGSAVSVRRGSLPEPGEGHYYLADLVGLEVVNERGEALGVVKRLFTTAATHGSNRVRSPASSITSCAPLVNRRFTTPSGRGCYRGSPRW